MKQPQFLHFNTNSQKLKVRIFLVGLDQNMGVVSLVPGL